MTEQEIEALKRLAKARRKETGKKLHICQDEIAQAKGFSNWALMMANGRSHDRQRD